MRHIVSRQPWGVLDIDTHAGTIFFQQDWQYTWKVIGAGVTRWTYHEKRKFHNTLDRQIWSRWSMKHNLQVSGTSAFAAAFVKKGVPINFDVRWVIHGGNWTVNAYKVPPGSSVNTYRSNVTFGARLINLYSIALAPYAAGNDAGATGKGFLTVPHEFGHALGAPDEYNTGSPFLNDSKSIMNIGSQIHDRHLTLILQTLNGMIPSTIFRF